ncbi:LamG domain-containing protein [Bailinhaonella thermotolerans]|uniref:LamG domain-containing protein n=1 Tax=Bailinhaonella thermotolerans TaxID=1070861 RepID=A0A3A4AFW3_9ACTN|nr:LamG domain-containing protein [Bailinhaonella thermotolerans]RJL24533.1 LamG domain-containing protein [Bailinhaonella thermotolerans]
MDAHASGPAPPDPAGARTPEQYVAKLAELRTWAGAPSLRRLRVLGGTTRAPNGDEVDLLPPSTTSAVLAGKRLPRLPRLDFVRAFVAACLQAAGYPAEAAPVVQARWTEAWRHLAQPAASPEPPPVPEPSAQASPQRSAQSSDQPSAQPSSSAEPAPGPAAAFAADCPVHTPLGDPVRWTAPDTVPGDPRPGRDPDPAAPAAPPPGLRAEPAHLEPAGAPPTPDPAAPRPPAASAASAASAGSVGDAGDADDAARGRTAGGPAARGTADPRRGDAPTPAPAAGPEPAAPEPAHADGAGRGGWILGGTRVLAAVTVLAVGAAGAYLVHRVAGDDRPVAGRNARPVAGTGPGGVTGISGWWRLAEAAGAAGAAVADASGRGRAARLTRALSARGTLDGAWATVDPGATQADRGFTLAAWVRLDAGDRWATVAGQRRDDFNSFVLAYAPETKSWAFFTPLADGETSAPFWAQSVDQVRIGRWTHLAAVHDRDSRRLLLYVDGELSAVARSPEEGIAPGPLDIGVAYQEGRPIDPWQGAISDVAVFGRPLSAEEIHRVRLAQRHP